MPSASTSTGSSSAASQGKNGKVLTNWAGTHSQRASEYYEPSSVAEIQDILRDAVQRKLCVRVIGAGHSPNACAMTPGVSVSLRRFNRVVAVDVERRCVRVQAGASLHEVNAALQQHGLALDNLGSISDQTVAGMLCTGTHGTAIHKGILGCAVRELQLVLSSGEVIECSPAAQPDVFNAAVVSLGALGIISEVVLSAVPAFNLRVEERPGTLGGVLSDFEARARSAEYYRFWWFPHTDRTMEWRAEKAPPSTLTPSSSTSPPRDSPGVMAKAWAWVVGTLFGFHILQGALYASLTFPLLVPWINRVWYAVLFSRVKRSEARSDLQFNFDCLFRQHVSEWALPLRSLPEAMRQLRDMIESSNLRVHFPVEVRVVDGDAFWLSHANGDGPVAYIGVIMYRPYGADAPQTSEYFRRFEDIVASHGGRPHWAKEFRLRGDAGFKPLYPKWGAFKALRERLDPSGAFLNPWLKATLGV